MIVAGRAVAEWVAQGVGCRLADGDTALGWLRGDKLVAGVLYTDLTGTSVWMHYRVEGHAGMHPKWLFAAFDYAFNEMKVKHCRGLVSSGNAQSVKTTEKLGWTRETTLKDYFPDGDGIVYFMRREDCVWLDFPNRQVFKDKRNGKTISSGT